MTTKRKIISLTVIGLFAIGHMAFTSFETFNDSDIVNYLVNPKTKNIKLYWKNDSGQILNSIKNLKSFVEGKHQKLLFAMNGGMYKTDMSPQGLYIEQHKVISSLDTMSGSGNFYLKPNGVFFITEDNTAVICKTQNFIYNDKIIYATQSGPMLIIDGKIHPSFKDGSANLNVRNGVGILPDHTAIFAMSKIKINFYDFAMYFKKLGCTNALYLDGFVSRMYLPEKHWIQTDGNFGIMIGVTEGNSL